MAAKKKKKVTKKKVTKKKVAKVAKKSHKKKVPAKAKLRSTIIGNWIEKYCRCPEGALVGQPLKLHSTQWKILRGVYDSPTQQAIISFGRKNGKTTLAACLVLVHLVGPEAVKAPNSQIYSSACSREQAGITFNLALKMARLEVSLSESIQVRESAKTLICPELGTKYSALSAEDKTAHGLSPKVVIHDELGQVRGPRSALYDALETGGGAHEETLSIVISTQARTDADLLSILIDDALTGSDPATKLFLWTAPEDANIWSPAVWKKANPLYGHSLNPKYVKKQADRAKRMPTQEAAFRNLILNQRVDSESPFIPVALWNACAGVPDIEVLKRPGAEVYGGLDLSGRIDLTAFVYGAQDEDGIWHIFAKFFTPQKGLFDRARDDRTPYDVWVEKGWITAIPGASVDYDHVVEILAPLHAELSFEAIAFDRWRIDFFEQALTRAGAALPLRPHGQGFKDMSPALDEVEAAVVNEKIYHGANPVLTSCMLNAYPTKDPAGNRKLDKRRATGKIDGAVALAMMFGAATGKELDEEPDPGLSIYNQPAPEGDTRWA